MTHRLNLCCKIETNFYCPVRTATVFLFLPRPSQAPLGLSNLDFRTRGGHPKFFRVIFARLTADFRSHRSHSALDLTIPGHFPQQPLEGFGMRIHFSSRIPQKLLRCCLALWRPRQGWTCSRQGWCSQFPRGNKSLIPGVPGNFTVQCFRANQDSSAREKKVDTHLFYCGFIGEMPS